MPHVAPGLAISGKVVASSVQSGRVWVDGVCEREHDGQARAQNHLVATDSWLGHKIIGTVSERPALEEYERLGGDSEEKHVGDKHLR